MRSGMSNSPRTNMSSNLDAPVLKGDSRMPSVKPLIASLAVALATASIASTAVAGQFDGVTVRIGTFGGKWRDVVDAHVAKEFEKEGGKIEYVLGQPANNMAKLIAARGQEPPFDILETMDNFLP